MAFFFLCVTVFVMFFQPAWIFPNLEAYQPLKNSGIIALLTYFIAGRKSETKFFSIKTNRYFIFFVLLQIISSFKLWSVAGIETFNLWLRLGIVYFLIFKSVTDEKKLKTILMMITFAISYLCFYSISNYALNYIPGQRAGGFGWYENSNDLSTILVSVIPLTMLLANRSKHNIINYIFILVSAMFSFNILFAGSRNGLLGLCCVGILSLKISDKVPKIVRTGLTVFLFIMVITVGITNVLSRSDLTGLTGDDSSEDRKVQWKSGLRMTLANPLFGVGRGEFSSNVADYQGIRGLEPHNTIIQVFGENGIPCGVFFILFSIFPLVDGVRFLKQRKEKQVSDNLTIYRFLLISLSGFWVCAFFSNRYQEYILYVVVALITAMRENILNKELLICKEN